MSLATRCPVCEALFRVSPEQLRLRGGQVRCGKCDAVFDGLAHLVPGTTQTARAPNPAPSETQPTAIESLDFVTESAALRQSAIGTEPARPDLQVTSTGTQSAGPRFAVTPPDPEINKSDRPPAGDFLRQNRVSIAASVLLALLLVAQLAMRQRDVLAAQYPGLRPVLAALCSVAGCQLALPRIPERLSIEGDEMIVADPRAPGRISLLVTLRNSAPFAVSFPSLELSLQDDRDQIVARRVLGPDEYLERGTSVKDGLAARSDVNLRLALDTGSTKADGYRVFLFYPGTP